MNMNILNFSSRLHDLRKERNLTIVQLSKELNCSKSIISYCEHGTKEPTLSALVSISNFFQVSIDDLIGVDNRIEYTDTLSRKEWTIIDNFRIMRPELQDNFISMSHTLAKSSDSMKRKTQKKKN